MKYFLSTIITVLLVTLIGHVLEPLIRDWPTSILLLSGFVLGYFLEIAVLLTVNGFLK